MINHSNVYYMKKIMKYKIDIVDSKLKMFYFKKMWNTDRR